MAAIDKLYVHSYYEYNGLRKWAIAYYPELLFYFYDITITYQQWEDDCRAYVKNNLKSSKKAYDKLGEFKTEEQAVANKLKWYKEQGIEIPIDAVIESVRYTIESYNKIAKDWEELYSVPIMNTPFEVDKKLLWICPVPCVRKYLEDHCGYKTKWYHKLFWRGKKHF